VIRLPLYLALLLAASCGRTWSLDGEVGGSSAFTTAGEAGGADADDDVGETGGDDEAEGDWGDETGETGGLICPQGDAYPDFFIESDPPVQPGVDLPCTVAFAFSEPPFTEIQLDCRDPFQGFERQIYVFLEHEYGAFVPLWPGAQVLFQHHMDWPNEWFAIHSGDFGSGMVVAGLKAEWPESPFGTVRFDPLQVGTTLGECEWFEDECGVRQRGGVQAWFDGSTTVVHGGNVGYVGELVSYQVAVAESWAYEELWCDDIPLQWTRALFVMVPEG
jgi:hypothetical protein